MSDRQCGSCAECCRTMEVKDAPDRPKAAGVPCPQMLTTPGRCACYATRPASCQAFRCAWLDGWGSGADRPDLLGVLFTVLPSQRGGVFMAHERPAGMRAAGRVVLERLIRERPVFHRRGELVELRGPAAVLEVYHRELAASPPPGVTELTWNGGRVRWRLAP